MSRRPTAQEICDQFNKDFEVGTKVVVKEDGNKYGTITMTESVAMVSSGDEAIIWLDGISGCYLLSFIIPIE